MSDIICQWLNSDVRLSKVVEPRSLSRDFASGYLIGEILHRFELQDDFHLFSKQSTANAKLNNFSRLEPTLQLLAVPFDLSMARAVMEGRQGAATHLLYQLYILLQKKRRSGLTAAAMELLQPAAAARLHRVEKHIYTERLKTVVRRETDLKMQKIARRFHKRGQDMFHHSVMTELLQEKERIRRQEERRMRDIEKHRQTRRKQQEMMIQIQSAVVQVPKPPASRSYRAVEKHQLRKQREAQHVHRDIAQFEKSQKAVSPAGVFFHSGPVTQQMSEAEREQWNRGYIQKIRLRLEEDASAREQREMRRRRALMDQLRAHEAEQEAIREEQMVSRLMRQTQQEKRIVVQLQQMKQQKEVLRQNRLFQESQYKDRRLQDFQEALDREAVLARQERLERSEEIQIERELHQRLAAERARARYHKHFDICREILGQIVDLVTKAGEYRLLTDNLIPVKLMQEWRELFLSGKPLYEGASVEPLPADPTPEQITELQKIQILNSQDYDEYVLMMGEWQEEEDRAPPLDNDILHHVLKRMQNMMKPPVTSTPPPLFPRFTIRACVLGKTHTGKSTCLTRVSHALNLHVLSVNMLIQEFLSAGERVSQQENQGREESQGLEKVVSLTEDDVQPQKDEETSRHLHSGPRSPASEASGPPEREDATGMRWSSKAQCGSAVQKILTAGRALPDQLLVDIIVDAIRNVPADRGWVLDGFPVNITQALLLEKALTGAEPAKTEENTQSPRAADKKTLKDPPHLSPALDLVVLLDVSDEQVLERAAHVDDQRREHDCDDLQKSPATFISTEKRLERDQIQHRINGFHDTWPKLQKLFGDKQNILVKVPAEADAELIFKNVETLLKDTMDSVEKGAALSHSRKTSSRDHAPAGSASSAKRPPATPTSAERVYVDEPLPQEIPRFLLPYWENVCAAYVTNIKTVMQNLRGERELIIHHLFDIRENFRQYLLKPDLKQEFVSVWQCDYNSVPDNIREDEETKGELHQRLDDLRERLWDICDKRKEEAVQERAGVIEDGWLEDHTAVLINLYSAFMQTEVSRCQDAVFLLRDYYSGMTSALLSHSTCDFIPAPLLDITWDNRMEPEMANMFPLVTSRSSSNELSRPDLLYPNEKLLQEFYEMALTAVRSVVCAEVLQREEECGDVDQQQVETQRTHEQSQTSSSAKDRKKAKQKGAPVLSQEASPQPVLEENPEEVKRRAVKRRIQQEFTAALKHQEDAVKARLQLVRSHGVRTVCSLQQRAEQLYTLMQEWLETRFLSEMKSIDQLADLARLHIENGLQIRHELLLQRVDFCVDGDTRVVASAPPTPPPAPLEQHSDGTLTVRQLHILCAQLLKTAPSGVLSSNELTEVLQEIMSPHMGCDVLPEPWMKMTPSQVVELVWVLAGDAEMLDWRQFVLSVALPWPFPSQAQLLKTLQRFRAVDSGGTGLVTEQQYTQVELWFSSGKDLGQTTELLSYDRLHNLRKFFFTLFMNTHSAPVMLDYMSMLLYFCSHPEVTQGFIRALSLVTEHPIHYKHTDPLLQSVPHMEGADVEEFEEEVRGAELQEKGVSAHDVLRVLSHGDNHSSAHSNRFQWNSRNRDEYREELVKVYKELGFKAEEKIPFSILSQHPFVQDLMETSSQYQLNDVHKILQTQKTDEV